MGGERKAPSTETREWCWYRNLHKTEFRLKRKLWNDIIIVVLAFNHSEPRTMKGPTVNWVSSGNESTAPMHKRMTSSSSSVLRRVVYSSARAKSVNFKLLSSVDRISAHTVVRTPPDARRRPLWRRRVRSSRPRRSDNNKKPSSESSRRRARKTHKTPARTVVLRWLNRFKTFQSKIGRFVTTRRIVEISTRRTPGGRTYFGFHKRCSTSEHDVLSKINEPRLH